MQQLRNIKLSVPVLTAYYVDSVRGSDSNSGRSASRPFANLTALPTVTNGMRIFLARGSSWRGEITINVGVSNVQIADYGYGALPIIDCSVILASGSWSKTAGKTNIYQQTITPEVLANGKTWITVFQDGAFMTRIDNDPSTGTLADDLTALDAAPGRYVVTSDITGTPTLYINATGSGDPASNGKVYEYSKYKSGVFGDGATDCTVIGIEVKKPLHNNGGIVLGKRGRIQACVFSYGNKHNSYAGESSQVIDCASSNLYYGGQALTHFVIYEDAPNGGTASFVRCTCANATYDASTGGFIVHQGGAGLYRLITFDTCSMSNMNEGIQPNYGTTVNISNCTFNAIQSAIRPNTGCVNVNITNCVGASDKITNALYTGGTAISLPRFLWTIENNLQINMGTCQWTASGASGGALFLNNTGTNLSFDHCTFLTAGTVDSQRTVCNIPSGKSGTVNAQHNTYNGWARILDFNGGTATWQSDFHTVTPTSTRDRDVDGVDRTPFSTWQTYGGTFNPKQEQNSVAS
jgi:hypothetical protein